MEIETPRLVLRDIVSDDLSALGGYRGKPEFYRHLPQAITENDTQEFVGKAVKQNVIIPRQYWYMAIVLKETSCVIGDIVLHRDDDKSGGIGFGLDPDYWRRGLMTEALSAMTQFAHIDLKMTSIKTGANEENIGSWRVLEKCGYIRKESARIFQYISISI